MRTFGVTARCGEPVVKLGPEAGGVVIGEGGTGTVGDGHPGKENACCSRLGRSTRFLLEAFMARRKRRRTGKRSAQPNQVHPDAAGVDVGATAVYAAVREDRATVPIRNFPTFTSDLHALADWLSECRVTTVAMESTSVYWIPVLQILEARGFDVVLVNARHVRSVPGRKSDVADCEWLRHLHAAGLLRGSFRPPDEVCALRTLLRHRDTLVKAASRSVLHMQKSYDQMNIHLHHAISDLTGVTGMAITDAILAHAGCDPLCNASTRRRALTASALERGMHSSICSRSVSWRRLG